MSLMKVTGANKKEAKNIASGMVLFLQEHLKEGRDIDLGFVLIQAKPTKPRVMRNNLTGKKYFKGESILWRLVFRRRWLKRIRPIWSFKAF